MNTDPPPTGPKADNDPPTLSDFGLSDSAVSSAREMVSRVEHRLGTLALGCGAVAFLGFFIFIYLSNQNLGLAIVASMFFGSCFVALTSVLLALLLVAASRLLLPRYVEAQRALKRFEQFNQALRVFQTEQRRRERAYWLALSPLEFEVEVATVFGKLGIRSTPTRHSGDEGIDIHLEDHTSCAIVQCKRYKNPASPALVRELYGALTAAGADRGVLVCTGGFTSGVRKFAHGKPIELIDLDGLLQLVETANEVDRKGKTISLDEIFGAC